MPSFIIAREFATNDLNLDFTYALESVGIQEDWLLELKYSKDLDRTKLSPLVLQDVWGDGTGTIPHFHAGEIAQIKENCYYILDCINTERIVLADLPEACIAYLDEFKQALKKLISMSERALAENLLMAFISN